ncbi:MAG TPA: hypothetical protein DEA62_00650 [Coxiellaceae bacterium]|nr:hypothetical protein [Coxiellaceae bacterium]
MTLPIQCPLCHSGVEKQQVLTSSVYGDLQHEHAFFKCEFCHVIYLYPQLTVDQEREFYMQEFESFMNVRSGKDVGWEVPKKHVDCHHAQFQRRWRYLHENLPKSGKILEFGCSSGFMLYPLIELGYECYGIEPSTCFSEYLKERGVRVFDNDLSISIQFDVIMHFFVLEHIRDPVNFIESNLKLLKAGGKLIIEIPNAADPLHTIYNIPAFEKFYWSIAHHWYFVEKSIHYLLSKVSGIAYKILKDQRYDLSNHIIWARDEKPGGMGKFLDYFGEKLDKVYRETMINSGYCDTLIVIINKENEKI